ncbi:MAG: ribosomal-processing cysteine protease Prp [Erysipelotrichaceae bacterium]|nr:ribosomal-processing cysteine protease Prp [Erysipelotrichaceae bacterium]MDY5252321.1 ribosomal-processing cysteine protease Prp [Erysipelotrichaceae bacterium]
MIKVDVQTKDDLIIGMNVSGHAEYAEHGNDLVCAGVSCIMFGLCNALDMLCQIEAEAISNHIDIKIDQPNRDTQLIMQTALIQLQTMEQQFSQFIRIKIQEV